MFVHGSDCSGTFAMYRSLLFIKTFLGYWPLWLALLTGSVPARNVLSANLDTDVVATPSPLVMGIFPRRDPATTVALFSPLADYLSERLGREVRLETGADFGAFWQGVRQGKYDLVHYNQYHYVRSHKDAGYRVILQNEELGKDKITGSLVVRRDSGIESVSDLRGRKVVFGGGHMAMQSHILARYLLMQGGLMEGDYFEQYALTPPKACIATFYRQAAAAGAGGHLLELPAVTEQIDVSEMRYLAVSPPMAHLPWAVAPDMPDELARRIQGLMLELNDSERGRNILQQMKLTGLHPAADTDYDRQREIIRTVLGENY